MVLSLHNGIKRTIRRKSGSPKTRSLLSSSSSSTSSKSNVKVVVRVRPQNEREQESGQVSIIKVMDENMLVFDPKEEVNEFYFRGKKQKGRDLLKKAKKDLKLAFDHVFDGSATNEEVFKDTTNSVVDGLLNGYNCSVFAYGATGAGKTFTMLGNTENPGITFLTVMELYKRIESIKDDKTCDVAVSYLEVYNETIHDLLMPSQPLALREDPQRGVVVSGLSLHKPKNAQDLMSMLHFGNKNRTQHPTDANSESSRSHAVFIAYVKQQDRTAGLQANVRVAKMVLIDLAGSERATVTRNCGARMREGANINKSLLALGNCINALADKKSKAQHIPYRDSKLTRLLKDSLGGNCQTVMIAAVSPSALTYEDTYNTLRYADRAKSIRAHLKKNVMSVDMHVTKYAKIVEDLRNEVAELKTKLKKSEETVKEPCSCNSEVFLPTPPMEIPQEAADLCSKIQRVFEERKKIQGSLLEVEIADRQLDVRLHWRRTNIEWLSYLSRDNNRIEKSTQKADHASALMERKRARWMAQKPELMKRLKSNNNLVEDAEKEVNSCSADIVKKEFELSKRTLELEASQKQTQHLQNMLKLQHIEQARSESIVNNALKLIREQQMILSGHGFLTANLITNYEDLQKQVEGCKEVVWADQETTTKKSSKSDLDLYRLSLLPNLDSCDDVSSTSNSPSFDVSAIGSIPMSSDVSPVETSGETTPQSSSFALKSRNAMPPPSPHVPSKIMKLDESVSMQVESSDSNKDACNTSISELVSPELSSTSSAVIRNMSSLVIDSAIQKKPSQMLSASMLFDRPLFNEGVKKSLNKQFGSPKSSVLNQTFDQPSTLNINLNETFDKSLAVDMNATYVCGADQENVPTGHMKPNVTFADAVKSPVVKKIKSTGFKTPSRSPLSAKNSTKKGANSAGVAKRSGGGRLLRQTSMRHLRSTTNEAPTRMKKFSSTSTLPLSTTKTVQLRNVFNRHSSTSTVSKLVPEKKSSNPLRRFL